jgi:hypothetical protein
MAERSKNYLKQEFRDGERPTGADFGDLVDSYLNKVDDQVTVDGDSNLDIPGGLNLGDATTGQPGTLRFNGGQLQIFDGTNWNNVAGGGGGAFTPVGAGPHVAFGGGNVGIGTFATPPDFRLEVPLGNNTAASDRVRFGSAAIHNGTGASQNAANFSHQDQSTGNSNFALRQGPTGDVNLNAPTTQSITISHNRTTARLFVAPNSGQVVIAGNALLTPDPGTVLQVNGQAGKTTGGGTWATISDVRLKQDIRPFEDGLDKLLQVQPIRFRYNGQLNTNAELEEVGVIGQEIEQVFPYMTSHGKAPQAQTDGNGDDDLLMFNSNALTYVMLNAIKELSQKVQELEARLGEDRES